MEPVFTHFTVIDTMPEKQPFRLELRFMHGDADGYTTDTWHFENEEELASAWRDLRKFNVLAQKYKYEDSRAGRERFFAEAVEVMGWDDPEVAQNYYYETYPRDHTYDSVRAQLDSAEGFVVHNGREYKLQLKD